MKLSDKYVAMKDGVPITTAAQLVGTKVRVNPETSAFIQELAFSLGFSWAAGDRKVIHTSDSYLSLDKDMAIWRTLPETHFEEQELREIQIQEVSITEIQNKAIDMLQSAIDKLKERGYSYIDGVWVDKKRQDDTLGWELYKEIYPDADITHWHALYLVDKEHFIKIALSRPKA